MILGCRAYQHGKDSARPLQLLEAGRVEHHPDGRPGRSHGKPHDGVTYRRSLFTLPSRHDHVGHIIRNSVKHAEALFHAIGERDEQIAPEVIRELFSKIGLLNTERFVELADHRAGKNVAEFLDVLNGRRVLRQPVDEIDSGAVGGGRPATPGRGSPSLGGPSSHPFCGYAVSLSLTFDFGGPRSARLYGQPCSTPPQLEQRHLCRRACSQLRGCAISPSTTTRHCR